MLNVGKIVISQQEKNSRICINIQTTLNKYSINLTNQREKARTNECVLPLENFFNHARTVDFADAHQRFFACKTNTTKSTKA